ncbi:hypothetical protein IQ22_02428 [Pseudomonas duriflava]|uniref:Uncharacterized protein n=1 Tax=Pseudomonas duriflava TaxID=459528 RepID=A0A562QAN9_9PSED|nr:hypothetical protein [Pseudomonas duriflava]TWI53818.1 hypothetical protein IQ22_02428 [Pseudomonas duriflava]
METIPIRRYVSQVEPAQEGMAAHSYTGCDYLKNNKHNGQSKWTAVTIRKSKIVPGLVFSLGLQ